MDDQVIIIRNSWQLSFVSFVSSVGRTQVFFTLEFSRRHIYESVSSGISSSGYSGCLQRGEIAVITTVDTPPEATATDPLRTLGIRTDLPEFDGNMKTDDFIDWIQTVECIFDIRDILDNLKVQKQRERKGKYKVESWDKMKRLLQSKFLPINHRQDSFLDYHNLRQQSLCVDNFLHEFERMRMRCDPQKNELFNPRLIFPTTPKQKTQSQNPDSDLKKIKKSKNPPHKSRSKTSYHTKTTHKQNQNKSYISGEDSSHQEHQTTKHSSYGISGEQVEKLRSQLNKNLKYQRNPKQTLTNQSQIWLQQQWMKVRLPAVVTKGWTMASSDQQQEYKNMDYNCEE
ncbi:reverse transcriptase domain-containing protein [Artemisia annua]|uniref:Reverse transcriptase domain-containing protein n=1 Tax=Artemisia annua TaxID=35608 RepID=A0A2U1P6D4_ARTAN|nr:reverse transcriptase domain-containing protein [Artemisia annua]